MTEWRNAIIGNCLLRISQPTSGKVQRQDYRASGLHPVVDQGHDLISGWTDDASGLISTDLPVVVFGDHTRVFKYIDFPFVRGADGTQILKPMAGIDPLFFYYACRAIDLPSRGYNRHFKALKEKEIQIPSPEEQRGISMALKLLDDAVSLQDEELKASEAAKRAAMRALFTRGLRGEPQKDTEFGSVPMSWEIRPIGDFARQMQYGLSVRGEGSGRYPILRMNCQQGGKVVMRDLQYVNVDESTAVAYRVKPGDILFNRTNSYELVGRTAIVEIETDAVFASYLVRVSVDEDRLDPRFLNHFLNWEVAQRELKKVASKAVGQANISAGKLRKFSIPVPNPSEQREIVNILDAVDRKSDLHQRKSLAIDKLFKVLLRELTTGKVPVADLDLSGLPSTRDAEVAA